jgi:two-component system, NarL family, sensor kinase
VTDDVLDSLIAAEQDERRRLALFLHDGPVQQLSGIALMLDGALHSLSSERPDEAREILEAALAQHRATIRDLRGLSFALEPVVLRDHGFRPALRALCDHSTSAYGIEFELDLEGATSMGSTASIALYTILRELLELAVRRGPPQTVEITLEEADDGSVLASIVDDADPERRRRSLEGIEERVRQVHGTLEIKAAESGTAVLVTLPAHTARR